MNCTMNELALGKKYSTYVVFIDAYLPFVLRLINTLIIYKLITILILEGSYMKKAAGSRGRVKD